MGLGYGRKTVQDTDAISVPGSLFSPDVHSILHHDFGDPMATGSWHGKADRSPLVDTSAGYEGESRKVRVHALLCGYSDSVQEEPTSELRSQCGRCGEEEETPSPESVPKPAPSVEDARG